MAVVHVYYVQQGLECAALTMEKMTAEAYSISDAIPTVNAKLRAQKIGVDIMKQKIHYSLPKGQNPKSNEVSELDRLIANGLKEGNLVLFQGPDAEARKIVHNAGGRVDSIIMNHLLRGDRLVHCTYAFTMCVCVCVSKL